MTRTTLALVPNDNAIAIAEEAFRAGYEAALADVTADWWKAWCEFEPSETMKDLTC